MQRSMLQDILQLAMCGSELVNSSLPATVHAAACRLDQHLYSLLAQQPCHIRRWHEE